MAKAVHDRMPVILNAETGAAWLDPQANAPDLQTLLRPYAGSGSTSRGTTVRS
jgi:putative SOS response-associated peptidase YedK